MKWIQICLILALSFSMKAQHTFSIVAVDPATGDIGSAGATCGDSIIWPGTPGAYIISDILPGVGGIHTQASYISNNQRNARTRMETGDSPQEIIDWLVKNDVQGGPSRRQYGIVDFNDGDPRSAGYTGSNCLNEKGHRLGDNYAIQGNILLHEWVLDSMEQAFLRTKGCFEDRIMASLQAANFAGADSRCLGEGTSSLSAFIRVAKPGDPSNKFWLDINVAGTPNGVEPLEILLDKYNRWKDAVGLDCSTNTHKIKSANNIKITPNPAQNELRIHSPDHIINKIQLVSQSGRIIKTFSVKVNGEMIYDLTELLPSVYFLKMYADSGVVTKKLVLTH